VSITEEERFYSIHTSHMSKETPQRVPLSLYLHHVYTKETRAKQPHLLVGFSLVLGFSGHILCLFVDGVIVLYLSLFSTLYLFHTYVEKLVTKYYGNIKEKQP
jgi:hypothetical protein